MLENHKGQASTVWPLFIDLMQSGLQVEEIYICFEDKPAGW
jgi:hypothetical protein